MSVVTTSVIRNRKLHQPGVYAVKLRKYIKVGQTSDLRQRLESMKGTVPFTLRLEYWREVIDADQRRDLERHLHYLLTKFHYKYEWFHLTTESAELIQRFLKPRKFIVN